MKSLQWACRRGMLELDSLLQPFLQEHYPQLSAALQQEFSQLLTYSDLELFYWLFGTKPAPADVASIVQHLLQYRTAGQLQVNG